MAYVSVVEITWAVDLESHETRAIARRVREELVPDLRSQPGFISYQGIAASEDPRTSVAVVTWDSQENAEAGLRRSEAWTRDVASRYIASRRVYSGEDLFSS